MSEMDGRVDSLDSVSLGSPRDHGRLCGVTEIGGVGGAFGGLVCSFSMLNAPGTLGMVRIPGGTALGRANRVMGGALAQKSIATENGTSREVPDS